MRNLTRCLITVTALSVTGCSGDNETSKTRDSAPASGSRVSESNVFSSPVKSLEKAEQLNQIVLDHKQSIDTRLR
jgi:hypothetical protein